MTDPVLSKELILTSDLQALWDEIDRLRATLTGIASCSTCEACRGAALRALGEQA